MAKIKIKAWQIRTGVDGHVAFRVDDADRDRAREH